MFRLYFEIFSTGSRSESKILRGAERSGGAVYQKIDGAERSLSGPLRSAPVRSAQTPLHRSTDFEPCGNYL